MKRLPAMFLLAALCLSSVARADIMLTDDQALGIGKRIWKNECNGTIQGLTTWNPGESFASLGIAHFIWYPAGQEGPFEESWPGMARYLVDRGYQVPQWMLGDCPWRTREEFMDDFEGPRLVSLRNLLAHTLAEQARYAAMRLEGALPKMLRAAHPRKVKRVETNFRRIASQPLGYYALMDYVNFKGEGTNPAERYNGQGWGLMQVLEQMDTAAPPMISFVQAADATLTRRVELAPADRNEQRWLRGWRNRLQTYLE
jgi:hypothetical protein